MLYSFFFFFENKRTKIQLIPVELTGNLLILLTLKKYIVHTLYKSVQSTVYK